MDSRSAIDKYIEACNQVLRFLTVMKRDWELHFQAMDEGWANVRGAGVVSHDQADDQDVEFFRRTKWRSDLICSSHLKNLDSFLQALDSAANDLSEPVLILAGPFLNGEYAFTPSADSNRGDRLRVMISNAASAVVEWIEPDNPEDDGWADGCFPVSTDSLIAISQAINREHYLLSHAEELLADQVKKGVAHSFACMEEIAFASNETIAGWVKNRTKDAVANPTRTPDEHDHSSQWLSAGDIRLRYKRREADGNLKNPDRDTVVRVLNKHKCRSVQRGSKNTWYFDSQQANAIITEHTDWQLLSSAT